jgi:hypothetical protein
MPKRDVLETTVGRMTVAELAAHSGRQVREIIDYALGDDDDDAFEARAANHDAPPVDTRTAAGRYAYDQAVFTVLAAHDGPMSALEIREHVGGTSVQMRGALARLVEDEIVTSTGQAAAPRYELS